MEMKMTKEAQAVADAMDYETDIAIHQYSSDSNFYYKLKVTDVMNMDYQYTGNSPTLEGVMECIKLHFKTLEGIMECIKLNIKQHQN